VGGEEEKRRTGHFSEKRKRWKYMSRRGGTTYRLHLKRKENSPGEGCGGWFIKRETTQGNRPGIPRRRGKGSSMEENTWERNAKTRGEPIATV